MDGYGEDLAAIHAAGFTALARRAPAASLHVGSFVDAPLPDDCDAVLAIWRGARLRCVVALTVDGDELDARASSPDRDVGCGQLPTCRGDASAPPPPAGRRPAALRAAGFSARTLRGGYAGEPMPRGLVAYLARKRS